MDYDADGTGTKLNDSAETRAIHEVFGPAAKSVSISSTKSMHGQCDASSGAIESVGITLLAMKHGVVPPTANFRAPDPECDLNYTPNKAQARPLKSQYPIPSPSAD